MYEQRTTWMVYEEMPFPKMQHRIETIAGFFVTGALFFIAMAGFIFITSTFPTETLSWDLVSLIAYHYLVIFILFGIGCWFFSRDDNNLYSQGSMASSGFWGGITATSLQRSRYMVFWWSLSPIKRHRFESVGGAIQFHDHKRLGILMNKRWFGGAGAGEYAAWFKAACLANNTTAADKLMPYCLTHLGAAYCLTTLLSPRTPYAYHADDLVNFERYRLNTVANLINSMDAADIQDVYINRPILNYLWTIYFPDNLSKKTWRDRKELHEEDIRNEQTIAEIGNTMARHPCLHDALKKSFEWQRLERRKQRGRWSPCLNCGRAAQEQLWDVRSQIMHDIESSISFHAITQHIDPNLGQLNKHKKM